MAEQFTLQEARRDGRTVHFDKRPLPPAAAIMKGTGNEFLPGSCFALNEHSGIRRRDDLHLLEHLPQGHAFADDLLEIVFRPDFFL